MSKFYDLVPKSYRENLEFRKELREWASGNPANQRKLRAMCEADVLFYFNTVLWVYEPRNQPNQRTLPFITWSHQDPVIFDLDALLSSKSGGDAGIEKARGEGASWICDAVLFRHWHLFPGSRFGLVSRTEAAVDRKDDPDSLMWKLDFLLEHLPSWFRPRTDRSYSDHVLVNKDNRSVFTGYAATGDVASGGRTLAILFDELAKFPGHSQQEAMDSTQYVTECRIFPSTYKGKTGKFYDMMTNPDMQFRRFVLDWKDNPTRNRGLYRVTDEGAIEELDQINNPLPEGYRADVVEIHARLRRRGFRLEGTTRSPWYDRQCARPGATPMSIAQELDRNPAGTVLQFIDEATIKELLKETAQPHKHRGMLPFDGETLEPGTFHPTEAGDLTLWCELVNGQPKFGRYAIGADPNFGTGGTQSSNAAASIIDMDTGVQVGELVCRYMKPDQFARACMALGKWFHNAYLGWEINGPGTTFTNTVIEFAYGNVYYREATEELSKKRLKKIGWRSSPNDKATLLGGIDGGGLYSAMLERVVTVRSAACLTECGEYIIKDGKVVHSKAVTTEDDGNKNEAHGDRVIALAIAVHLLRERPKEKDEAKAAAFPPNSHGARIQELAERQDSLATVGAGEFIYE